MTLPMPDIDNTDFEQLVEQARLTIPRYAGEWTDHNVHDPGMTLIELAAWLVDQHVYAAGFVSDEHLQAFAALFGIRAQPAQPSVGMIWPDQNAVAGDPTNAGTDLPSGAQAVTREQPEIVFRTLFDTHLTPARLRAEPAIDSGDEAIAFELQFDRPLAEVGTTMPVAIGIELAGETVTFVSGAEGRLALEYRLEGDTAADPVDPWQRLEIVADTTAALSRSGVVLVRAPVTGLVPGMANKRRSRLRARLRYRSSPIRPVIARIGANVVAVEQRDTVAEALIGTGDGLPAQTYDFDGTGMDPAYPPIIEVAEDSVFVLWRRVDTFENAGPGERDYRLDAGRLTFGNGVNGRIPASGAQIRHRGYLVTRGAGGNLTAELDWRIQGATLSNGVPRFGTNPRPTTGGADAWDANRLRAAAREQALARRGLVTNTDLTAVSELLRTLGVQETDVLVGFDPARPFATAANSRTLLVTPGDRLHMDAQQYLAAVSEVVTPGRVLGERLHFAIKAELPIDVRVSILIRDAMDPEPILSAVQNVLRYRLSALRRSADVDPWPAGRAVERGEIEILISRLDGVVSVLSCLFARHGDALSTDPLPLAADVVATLAELELTYRAERAGGGGR